MKVRIIRSSTCPKRILSFAPFRDDGSCLCEVRDDDPCPCGVSHTRAEHGYDPDIAEGEGS